MDSSRRSKWKKSSEAVGICLGASTISAVCVERRSATPSQEPKVTSFRELSHGGDVRNSLLRLLPSLNLDQVGKVGVTGRRFRQLLSLSSVSEPEAVEFAYRFSATPGANCSVVVSLGGETSMAYLLDSEGHISGVKSGSKCASGTGEFFLQQARRLGLSPEEAAQSAACEEPYRVSGRCSVFCKSDCTHACNKGVPRSRVISGVAQMMAGKILELLDEVPPGEVMLVGGGTRNRMLVHYLARSLERVHVPEHACHFEALGAALWALDSSTLPFPGLDSLLSRSVAERVFLPPLAGFENRVRFQSLGRGKPETGDRCVLGLDVGSTTTKAVLMRLTDDAILASEYLRTNGDPVGASRQCYRSLLQQLSGPEAQQPDHVRIVGLGVTGSGRQISGLHAEASAIINEVVAHATAAAYFDPEVDTIFEIGGQDAKYTLLSNGVPVDYAMNEACSAGTGSFLEEAAEETLEVQLTEIAQMALQGKRPPNFNDQCAAFIASDVKNAIQDGIGRADVVAGLVYAICTNFLNRVKGHRPVGEKVFMQGGVCYNHAVPLAMARLLGRPVIVPPEPGLVGAFGTALEVKSRLALGRLPWGHYRLAELAERMLTREKSFTCAGGKQRCERKCEINLFQVNGRLLAFGGACNLYANLREGRDTDSVELNLVRQRQRLVWDTSVPPAPSTAPALRVGLCGSYLMETYLPLFRTFFAELGFEVVVSRKVTADGCKRQKAAFCYPGELAHGIFYTLLQRNDLDFIYVPHLRGLPTRNGYPVSRACPLVQAEPYYLSTAFRSELTQLSRDSGTAFVTTVVDLTGGLEFGSDGLMEAARKMGVGRRKAREAYQKARFAQLGCNEAFRCRGREVLEQLASDPAKLAIVLFGRPYNAFAEAAHKGIPNKIASRGFQVVPFDFLPEEGEPDPTPHMYWGMGQLNLRAARIVRDHPQLFGVWITNFSCGPDSFLVSYFRDIMGSKPSLTLELDSHTADAGLETRIEAFLDILTAYRGQSARPRVQASTNGFRPARVETIDRELWVRTSSGERLSAKHPRVKLVFPNMGRLATEAVAAGVRGAGYRAIAASPGNETLLKLGRAHTSGKECFPLVLTTGTLLNEAQRKGEDEVLLYFMPTADGPCRFGQYHVFMDRLIRRCRLRDVATFSLHSGEGYGGMGREFSKRVLWSSLISDLLEDIRSLFLANAIETEAAARLFEGRFEELTRALEYQDWEAILQTLREAALAFSSVKGHRPWNTVPMISLLGEIYVRREDLSRQYLPERLAQRGFALRCAHVTEWIKYCQVVAEANQRRQPIKILKTRLRQRWITRTEGQIRAALSASGLILDKSQPVKGILDTSAPYLNRRLGTEALLTVGAALHEVASRTAGVIAIGPFGCMPNRISEAILNQVMTFEDKASVSSDPRDLLGLSSGNGDLPFLAIESDGRDFPQVIEARLEAFLLRVRRLHERMLRARSRVLHTS